MARQKLIKSDSAGNDTGNQQPKIEKSGSIGRPPHKIKKDITICFRTSPDVRNYVESIALQTRQSLSYIIESIIYQHHKQHSCHTSMSIATERRRYSRKSVALPALFSAAQPHQANGYDSGTVLDISLGGIRFAIPKKTNSEANQSDPLAEYHVVFTLPEQHRSVAVRCKPMNVSDVSDEIHVGAAFVDADFNS